MLVSFRRLLVISLVFAAAAPVRADKPDWPVVRGPSRAPAPVKYDPAAWKDVPAEFLDDSPACILYSGTVHRLEADGTVETTSLELIRMNGRKGIDQLGEYKTITYAPSYEKVTLHEARVHKAKGGIVDVGPRHIQVRDVNTDNLIYDSSKQVVISFPGLETGDVIEVHWTTRGRPPEYQGQFFWRYTFGNDKYPVARDEWTVRVPKDRPLKFDTVNGPLQADDRVEGDEHVVKWSVANRKALPKDDHLPSLEELRLMAAASTFETWDDVFKWEKAILADRNTCTPDVQKIVAEVTKGLTDQAAKAQALAQWVRRHVRYISSGEKHDYTPHPPAQVIAHRYGDCKDTAHLLRIMLVEAGVPAGVATLGTRGEGHVMPSVPSPWGSHAIAVATIDGKEHWIDTTANQLGWDVLPRDDRDRACYVTDDTTLRLTRTPKMLAADAVTEQAITLKVAADGSVKGERTATYSGLAAWTKRDDYIDTPSGECRRLVAGDLQDIFTKAKLTSLKFDDKFEEYDAPLVLRSEFDVPDMFAGDKGLQASVSDQTLWTLLLSISVNPERTAPIEIGDPFTSKCTYRIEVPTVFKLDKPIFDQTVNSKWGTFKLKSRPAKGDQPLEFEMVTTLDRSRVEASEFEAFQNFTESVQSAYRVSLSFKPTTDSADIPKLAAAFEKAPDDATLATTLAELYITAEKPAEAAKVLEKARVSLPKEPKIWELSLKVAEDAEAEEALYRQMVTLFPDEPKHVLALGEILLAAGEHDEVRKVVEPLVKHRNPEIRFDALLTLAQSSFEQDDPKKAMKFIKVAEKAHPAGFDAHAFAFKAEVHEALGERAAAVVAYRKSLESLESSAVLEALARLAIDAGHRDEALSLLRRLAAMSDKDVEGQARAADGFARLGRFDEAYDLATQAKEGGALHPLARRPLGLALAHRGKLAEAVEQLTKAELNAVSVAAVIDALIALGRLTDAEEQAERARGLEDPSPESKRAVERVKSLAKRRDALAKSTGSVGIAAIERFVCAESLYSANRPMELIEPLLDPRFGPAAGLRAVLELNSGRLIKSLRDAEDAIKLAPDDARGWYARGRVKLERGTPGALDDLIKAAELSRRRDGAVLHALAAALAQSGRKTDAVAAQREAVALRPDDREAKEQLRELESK